MAVQLAAVGFVLKFVFAQTSPLWTLLIALVMVAVAGYELMQRHERRLAGWWAYGLGNMTLLLVGGLATLYAVAVGHRAAALVCPSLRAAHSRHGARQHADQHQPGAADADRGRRARAGERSRRASRWGRRASRPLRRCCGGRYDGDDAAAQLHERGRHRLAARHDDRPDPGRRRPGRGRQVSDHDHVRALGRIGPRRARRRATAACCFSPTPAIACGSTG